MDLYKKVIKLSNYLDDEAIANALKITPAAVKDIREGKADITEINQDADNDSSPVIQVNSIKTAYRQKVISIFRTKGGVGCTVTAVCLAYQLSKEIKVLLIDLNFANGGSDLAYYLNLPEYPHMGVYKAGKGDLSPCVIEAEPNLHVLKPSQNSREFEHQREMITEMLTYARQDYDAVIMDMPNRMEELEENVLRQSNTIVAVTEGMEVELARLATSLSSFQTKDIIIATNKYDLPPEAMDLFKNVRTSKLELDQSLTKTFEKCDLPREKSPFMKGIIQITDIMFDRKQKGFLKKIFGGE